MDQNSRSSSLRSHQDDTNNQQPEHRRDKLKHLDYYSIPVFLLEVVILTGLAYLAYYLHFEYTKEPYLSGIYCDDTSFRKHLIVSKFTRNFINRDDEIIVIASLLIIPVVLIFFCELVNSLFGAIKFRQIRALCACCKLHSITRRSIRFTGAYTLGYLFVMISCEVLATLTGHPSPYFAQKCHKVYRPCGFDLDKPASIVDDRPGSQVGAQDVLGIQPAGTPISSSTINASMLDPLSIRDTRTLDSKTILHSNNRIWIPLDQYDLKSICDIKSDYEFNQLVMSWPSYTAAIFTYACLFVACYLCFVGTARPFRIITSCLVVVLLLLTTVFNVQLVKEHFNHWEDVVAGAILAAIVVIFILMVYLNRFKDSHYYGNQKVATLRRMNSSFGQYSVRDKIFPTGHDTMNNNNGSYMPPQVDDISPSNGGGTTGNDLAMRYFQIPRANYRGAPRPLSSMNQMRL